MGSVRDKRYAGSTAPYRGLKAPKTTDDLDLDSNIFGTLLSFCIPTVELVVRRDCDMLPDAE